MAPNPLPVALWGYAPEDAAQLLRYIVDECADAGIKLAEVRAAPVIVHQLTGSKTEVGATLRDIPVNADARLHGQLNVYLREPFPERS